MWWIVLLLVALAGQAVAAPADVVVPRHTLRAQTIITADDLSVAQLDAPDALTNPDDAIGREARVALYPGRPIRPGDLRSPTLVERNQAVTLSFRRGPLTITVEGRALARGGVGDSVRVLNTASHTTVQAVIGPDGHLTVLP